MTISDPTAGKPRVVCEYAGLQIVDARDTIRMVLNEQTLSGMRACLKAANFKPSSAFVWERPASPDAYFKAQEVAALFYEEKL